MQKDITSMKEFGNRKKYEDVQLMLIRDDEPDNPRNWDNVGTFAMYHRRMDYGDKKLFDDPSELIDFLKKNNGIWLPVFMIDHSGIAFSTKSFGDPWDSGQVGVIYATHEDIVRCYGEDTPENREIARRVLASEIETLNDYVQGNVYGFVLLSADGEIFDSMYGFYPDKDSEYGETVAEALATYDGYLEKFSTPKAAEKYVRENRENFFKVPDELRTAELTQTYLDMGGDVRKIPERYQKIEFCPG